MRRRAASLYRDMRRRALLKGHLLQFYATDLQQVALQAFLRQECPYCRMRLDPERYSFDHRQPVSRGGSWALDNLDVCCKPCNTAKGPLDFEEWRELLKLLNTWHPKVKQHTLARLRRGGRVGLTME